MQNEMYAFETYKGYEIFVTLESVSEFSDEDSEVMYEVFVKCYGDYRFIGTYFCGEMALDIGMEYVDSVLAD